MEPWACANPLVVVYTSVMQTSLLMTVLGPDRPGIVETLSGLVADAGGNWLESSMSHLGGHFAGIVQVTLPSEAVDAFRSELAELKSRGLDCVVQDTVTPEGSSRGTCYSLEIVGHDRPGIVSAISDVIVQAGGNVEKFSSLVESAPMSGDLMFKAKILVCFPAETLVEGLDARFAEIGDELMLDVQWRADAG